MYYNYSGYIKCFDIDRITVVIATWSQFLPNCNSDELITKVSRYVCTIFDCVTRHLQIIMIDSRHIHTPRIVLS